MQTPGPTRRPRIGSLVALFTIGLVACGDPATQVSSIPAFADAKPGGGTSGTSVTVTSTDPPYGHRGDSRKLVRVFGSGFSQGAQASWELNGSPSQKITVLSTQYVSSTEVDATINIASDADLTLYNVAVTTTNGKKGIGTELFEVTTAQLIAGAGLARDANDNGQMVGQIPGYFWDINTGVLDTLPGSNSDWGVSEDGQVVVGAADDGSGGAAAAVWTRSGSSWVEAFLPRSTGTSGLGHGRGVGSDLITGAAVAIAGVENHTAKGNKLVREPRLWTWSGSGWQVRVLPGSGGTTTGQANDVTPGLVVVGNTAGGATVWSPNGSGGWTAAVIGAAGSDADAINSAGDMVVGTTGTAAAYWQRSGSSWTGPITLPGGCARATGVDDLGRIVAQGCPVAGTNRITSMVITAPYSSAEVRYLTGFGSRTDGPQVEAISRQGHYIVGRALYGNSGAVLGAFWALY